MAKSIILKGIGKAYNPGKKVLQELNLTINQGEMFFLLGPSGCGKSTLLRIIAGLLEPDCGEIYFDEQRVDKLPPEKRAAAMVFQSYALWPHMTVFENVAFGLKAARVKAAEITERVNTILAIVQLSDLAARKITSLSGGQQQRVALARALVVDPAVLLLDEPLSNLDARLRDHMRGQIRAICKSKKQTAVYVTHDRQEALSMADRIAVMDEGVIQQLGTPRELYRYPVNRFVASFLGETNFVPARIKELREDGSAVIDSALGLFRVERPGDRPVNWKVNGAYTALFRPESVRQAVMVKGENIFEAVVSAESCLGEVGSWTLQCELSVDLTMNELAPQPRELGKVDYFYVSPHDIVLLED